MEELINEMYENFLMSEACSKYYLLVGEDTEAQDWSLYFRLKDHIELCQKAALACKNFLDSKNLLELLTNFSVLGLDENIMLINKCLI